MPKKFGQRMDDGGAVSSSTSRRSRREAWRTAHDTKKYSDRYARLKEKYPSYTGWGTAPTNRDGYKSFMESFRQWRKENAPEKTPRTDPRTSWLQKNYGQIEGYLKDPSSFFSSDLFKRLNPQAANAWAQYRSSMNTTPAQTPAPVTTPSGVAAPGLQKNWADTVKNYFPQTMKAGGLVRGGGAAQRGVGKGKMR